ncbi:EGF-like domain protein [Cooperia oncophora]
MIMSSLETSAQNNTSGTGSTTQTIQTSPPPPDSSNSTTTGSSTASPETSLHDRKCGNAGDTEYCYYENTTEICDICKGVICPNGKKCVKQDRVCATNCVCRNDIDVEDENGICRTPRQTRLPYAPSVSKEQCSDTLDHVPNKSWKKRFLPDPCELHPCMHGGVCTADIAMASRFRCTCGHEYEGERCEKYHNFCLDPKPSFCPAGEYDCEMHGFRNYSCNCAEGFYYNVTGKQCVKVGEQVTITLIFKQTPYSEIFNNLTHPEAISARRVIQAAFDQVYGVNLIKLVFNNFTQGSLVAHLQLMLKLHDSGTFRNNEKIFKVKNNLKLD